MIKNFLSILVLVLALSSCSDKNNKTKEEIVVIHEEKIIEQGTSKKENLENTIQNLEDLNAKQEKELIDSETKAILEEESNDEKEELKNTILDLEKLNKEQEKIKESENQEQ